VKLVISPCNFRDLLINIKCINFSDGIKMNLVFCGQLLSGTEHGVNKSVKKLL
jgi:hypothetical protein